MPPSSTRDIALVQAIDCSAAERDAATAIIAAVDRADDDLLAQLQFIRERLTTAQLEPPEEP
jgi:hypothetical protein